MTKSNTITTSLTKQEAARNLVEIIEDFYTSNKMDISIGFTENGDIDYQFDVHGGDVVVPVYRTQDGWNIDNEGDPELEEYWTDEIRSSLAEIFAYDMDICTDFYGDEVDVEFRLEEKTVEEIHKENN